MSACAIEPCDTECIALWFRQEYRHLESLPPEVEAEALLQAAQSLKDRDRVEFLLERVGILAETVPEPCPIRNLLRLTDSVPGAAARLLFQYPTRSTLAVDKLRVLARFDPKAVAESLLGFRFPSTQSPDEECSVRNYFDFALELADSLIADGDALAGNLLLVRTIQSVRSMEALADLSEVLVVRLQRNRLSPGLLNVYLQSLGQIRLASAPNQLTLSANLWFWQTLLREELANRKNELLGLLASLFASLPASRVPEPAYRVSTQAGVVNVPPFWPDRARKLFQSTLGSMSFTETEADTLRSIEKSLFAPAATSQSGPILERSVFWARPASLERFQSLVEMKRSWNDQNLIGAAEPKLNSLLAALRTPVASKQEDADHILDFLERHYHWLSLFVFNNYRVQAPSHNLKPEEIQALAAARIQHSAKETILRDVFNNLESEEGRWVYNHRRAFWIGFLRLYIEEINSHQPELKETLSRLASATASDIIAVYAR